MFRKIVSIISGWDSKLRRSFGKNLSTPSGRFGAFIHYNFFDHAFLRIFWTNYFEIAPGVFRSNQPTARRFKKYRSKGLNSVLNLRGCKPYAHYQFEKIICKKLGLDLVSVSLKARKAPEVEDILFVIKTLEHLKKPLLFHCKSGADRAGFVSAIYLMVFEGCSVEKAHRQLGFRYFHLDFTATGILDYVLWVYALREKQTSITFLDWFQKEYVPQILQTAFDKKLPLESTLQLLECSKKLDKS